MNMDGDLPNPWIKILLKMRDAPYVRCKKRGKNDYRFSFYHQDPNRTVYYSDGDVYHSSLKLCVEITEIIGKSVFTTMIGNNGMIIPVIYYPIKNMKYQENTVYQDSMAYIVQECIIPKMLKELWGDNS